MVVFVRPHHLTFLPMYVVITIIFDSMLKECYVRQGDLHMGYVS